MKPIVTEQNCLKCHAHQGYKVGNVRGGISVTIPMKKILIETRQKQLFHLFWYLIVCMIGLAVIHFGTFKLKQQINERNQAYTKLEQNQVHLEAIVKKRTKQLSEANKELEYLSFTDSLTEAANRRSFDKKIQTEWYRAMRQSQPIAIIIIDIDYFKLFNDLYGHQRGDECLRQVAMSLNNVIKRAGEFMARIGGEEFAIALLNTNTSEAIYFAEKLRISIINLKIPHEGSKINDFVTISLGVASLIPEKSLKVEQLIFMADTSLYSAKIEGRNQVKSASPDNKTNK